ncbi:MAG: metallophosphoesterase family protein [Verrucomicrobia bacterium]|nr:metallophosphoesterase family protein [Verrucomicrobiota bacterium]
MQKSKPPAFFAIISDIHANIDALDAVLADIEQWPCRGILCLGDIVGYGPEPAACVQRVMDTCAVSVFGNHEAMLFLAEQFPPEELGATVGDPITLAFEQVSEDQMKWLRGLPISADLDPMVLSHAALNDIGSFHYIHDEDEAKAHFAVQTTFVSFQGHTHVPVIWEEKRDGRVACFNPLDKPVHLDEGDRYAINVGSVGQPRDDDPRACYALYDYQNRLLLHRRVEYDIARAQARFKKAKLPARNASRLKKGQ